MLYRISNAGLALALLASLSPCQQNSPVDPAQPAAAQTVENRRILGIIPNFRSSPSLLKYEPLTRREKFKMATEDALDRGTITLAVLFGGQSQLTNANRSFGQGVSGFGKYVGTAYGDFVIGDYMTEAILPTLLRQDPRYFRRGTGGPWSRIGYAVGQIFWTHRDSGGKQFNYSEVLGNSAAVGISNAYYPNGRAVGSSISKLGMQLGLDMGGNFLREFWPDLERKLRRKHPTQKPN